MENEDTNPTSYPLGRGYGHDYMRGGEVFGGYGYREREDYARTRGGDITDPADAELGEGAAVAALREQAGAHAGATEEPDGGAATDQVDDAPNPPVPHLEQTYGDTGRAWRHSRSYYVTQAQLQQRIYGPQRYGYGPYRDRLRALKRDDAELRRDVQEALFFDTWIDAQQITLEVQDGVVTLRGTLASPEEVRYACDDAWGVAGVREVQCELHVAGDAGRSRT
jgi:hypothetical protein